MCVQLQKHHHGDAKIIIALLALLFGLRLLLYDSQCVSGCVGRCLGHFAQHSCSCSWLWDAPEASTAMPGQHQRANIRAERMARSADRRVQPDDNANVPAAQILSGGQYSRREVRRLAIFNLKAYVTTYFW